MSSKPTIAEQANPNYVGDPPYTGAWKGCAHDPELPGPLYTADQVRVPVTLEEVVRLYSKAVIRDQPKDILRFSKQWFEERCREQQDAEQADLPSGA